MTQTAVPHQPPGGRGDPQLLGKPPVPPTASEAGRLLCAGTYLDGAYRDRVIDELYVHEERIAAPSYGYDAARVLAHALRARRAELLWATGIVALFVLGSLLTEGLFLLLVGPCLGLNLAAWITEKARGHAVYVRVFAFLVRLYARLLFFATIVILVVAAFTAESDSESDYYDDSSSGFFDSSGSSYGEPSGPGEAFGTLVFPAGGVGDELTKGAAWGVLALFACVAALKAAQRGQFARVLAAELSPQRYPDLANDPAEQFTGARFRKVQRRIRTEQHWPLVMYSVNNPFCGAGGYLRPWNLSVELRPRTDLGPDRKPVPLDNAQILHRIVPLVEALRVPSAHGSPQASAAVLDRLRELVVDECVFLPANGLLHRDQGPYRPEDFGVHRAGSVEEGGEKRRHFLRIRVGGWDEEVVVTVFVRVHTQGGMLMLELAPHALFPVRDLFQEADELAQRYRNNNPFGKAVWAATHTPRALGGALATLGRGLVSAWRIVTEGNGGARPTGPHLSVRELGSDFDASVFQDMDIDRYLKTVQDRVAAGVKLALRDAGWQTGEFEQKIVNLAAGATYVGAVHDSAVNFGSEGSAHNTNTSTPQQGGNQGRGAGNGA
ncbi:hypothetical protein ACWCQL_05640 [Streptomyces sp. NPDC002073]|uniref:hypothetical protein n=1 Tax=Streptomyces sp. NBC_00239 TaxID=2903640 RepID=UPI002E2E6775|nr:hypothetical protein [Streptomyces sp. NBC_00239]